MEEHTKRMLFAASCIAVACSLLFLFGVFNEYQTRLADTLYGQGQASTEIVIVGIDDRSLQEQGRWPWPRERFAPMLSNLGQAAAIGIDIGFFEPSSSRSDAILAAAVRNSPVVLVSEYTNFSDGTAGGLLRPRLEARTGYANVVADRDGVVRSLNLDLGAEQAFSAAVYELYTGKEYEQKTRFLINYAGPPQTFRYYSATDIIKGKIPQNEFRGKIVLVGATARDFHDDAIVPTSHGRPMPGVEIHANALQTMLLDNEPRQIPAWTTIAIIVIISFLIAFLVLRFSLTAAGLIAVLLFGAYIYTAIRLFEQNWIPNIFYVPFTIVLAFIVLVTVDLVNERLLRHKVAAAFGKYVSPALAHEIMKKDIELGGEQREITILFSDIRGFTSISERLTPEELVDFLNAYFTKATKIIMERNGLVDKFIGDAIMAFWNAPLSDKEHAQHAVLAAVHMRDVIEEIRHEHGDKYPRLDVGIGVNTGDAVVGNVGSKERLSYTAIGDSVNLASRLEGLTKVYGVEIIISEHTKRQVKGFALRELDRVKVKGKKQSVTIYEVIGMQANADKASLSAARSYETALHLYYRGRWKEALAGFSKLHDPASKLMISRCKEFMRQKPEHWDGAYEMKVK